ncbi:thermonuclease family protein [Bacillus solimangrovi]|nr:thermonuclease family protein [Bacillus solimangrovi]
MGNARKIELEFDIGPQRDKYGRLLAYVYVDENLVH